MIRLPHEPTLSSDPLLRAGSDAEKQMAFYLDREFASSAEVMVFHGLRIAFPPGLGASNDDHFQIDHLVVARECAVLVESKSVLSAVRVNDHDEWSRLWNGQWKGIASPLKQVERQQEALRRTLTARKAEFLPKLLGLQTGMTYYKVEVVVALSDSATFHRPPRWKHDNVMKAEAVVAHIRERMRKHRFDGSALGLLKASSDVTKILSDESFAKLCSLLTRSHQPPARQSAAASDVQAKRVIERSREPQPAIPAAPSQQPAQVASTSPPVHSATVCRHCASQKVQIVHAAYGYCFRCEVCSKFTPIDFSCSQCGTKSRVRKQGWQFFRACAKCNVERVFWTNSAR